MPGEFEAHQAQCLREAVAREATYRQTTMFFRAEWRRAAAEALRCGAPFTERATREPARRWDGRMTAFGV